MEMWAAEILDFEPDFELEAEEAAALAEAALAKAEALAEMEDDLENGSIDLEDALDLLFKA